MSVPKEVEIGSNKYSKGIFSLDEIKMDEELYNNCQRYLEGKDIHRYYVDDIENCFERVGAHDIASLLKGAKHLYDVLENDAEDNEEGDYATYNFSDFTHEYKTLIAGTNFNKKVISYIRLNKALFKGDERWKN